MKKLFLMFAFLGIVIFAVNKIEAKAPPPDDDVVVGSYADDGFCDPGGVECAYVELPPVIL